MKTRVSGSKGRENGSGLMLTLIMTTIVLATLAGALSWSAGTTQLNERVNEYNRAVAAADGNTEAVLATITRDFGLGGPKTIADKKANYNKIVLANTGPWAGWNFSDAQGNSKRTYVSVGTFDNFEILESSYAGLKGYVCPVRIVSNARLDNSVMKVIGAVGQSVQLANIPIFQFAMFSSADMEISCGQPFQITGKVHSNRDLYVEPDNALTFQSEVSVVGDAYFSRHPLDVRGKPAGSVNYLVQLPQQPMTKAKSLNLPIGTNNTPEAVREIVEAPDPGEDVNSPLGRERYYNQVDMIITVNAAGGITATTGVPFNKHKTIPWSKLSTFITTSSTFTDAREEKVVRPIDIDIGNLRAWNDKSYFGGRDLMSLYVDDQRSLPATELAAVRLRNGRTLPPGGLTVATARPLYVQGNYNAPFADLGTANTAATLPASLVADAITILSGLWADPFSGLSVATRVAAPTTVNAALLTGVVETTAGKYSGGMENFPRFLETWGLTPFTYNGSMVKMFPSKYAIAPWGKGNVYAPPKRNWAYDLNFNDPKKLPPLTPCVQKVIRGQWASLPPGQITIPAPSL